MFAYVCIYVYVNTTGCGVACLPAHPGVWAVEDEERVWGAGWGVGSARCGVRGVGYGIWGLAVGFGV